jgi:hypothetical protein
MSYENVVERSRMRKEETRWMTREFYISYTLWLLHCDVSCTNKISRNSIKPATSSATPHIRRSPQHSATKNHSPHHNTSAQYGSSHNLKSQNKLVHDTTLHSNSSQKTTFVVVSGINLSPYIHPPANHTPMQRYLNEENRFLEVLCRRKARVEKL